MRDTHYTSWQTKLEAQAKALNATVGKEAVRGSFPRERGGVCAARTHRGRQGTRA